MIDQMKILLTLLSLSLSLSTVHASSGQLSTTQTLATPVVDTILDNSNCKFKIQCLEAEMEMLQKEIWDLEHEMDELYRICPADSAGIFSFRLAVGSMLTPTQFFALDYSDASQSPYFDGGMFGNWTLQVGRAFDPFEANCGNVGLLVGSEVDYSRVKSAQRLEAVDGAVSFAAIDTTLEYKSNAMHLGFVKFPLMGRIGRYSEFGSGSVQFCAGIVPGIRYLGAITTRSNNGASAQSEISRNLGLRRFVLNSRVTLSAKNVELFMESSLLSLFKIDAANPVVYPTTFGIALSVTGY